MAENTKAGLGSRTLLLTASFVIIVAGLKTAADLFLPFLMATFLAMISLPLLNFLLSKKVPGALAVLLTVLTEIAFIAGIVTLVGGSIKGFTEEAPRYQAMIEVLGGRTLEWLAAQGIEVSREVAFDLVNPGTAFNFMTGALRGVAGVLSRILIVVLIIILLLAEATGFPAKLEAAFGRRNALARYEKIRAEVQHYLGIKTAISLVTGALVGTLMALLGIEFPVLWGLLAFLLNYIPTLGSLLAAIPPVMLAVIQYGFGRAVAVALVFLAINLVLGNFVEPFLMGRRLGLSTLVVFLSLVFWGWVWGPIGMLLSVPLTMVLKIMLENSEDFRWVAILLDASPRRERTLEAQN